MNRREFLTTAGGATGALVAGSGTAAAQEDGNKSGGNKSGDGTKSGGGVTKTYKLGGKVAGWQGQAPASIKGKTNPPLVLKPGQKYKIVWENLDGMPHDFTIKDSGGNTIKQTKTDGEEGENPLTHGYCFETDGSVHLYSSPLHDERRDQTECAYQQKRTGRTARGSSQV